MCYVAEAGDAPCLAAKNWEHDLPPLPTSGRKRRLIAGAGSSSKRKTYRRRFWVLSFDSTFVKSSPIVAGCAKILV
ncbi:MAG: hypothetical protein IKK39_13130 [Thermoguttaceae bacterium]|nr:hypothetical protein [Thermoguttaceae bacterium]MBR4104988.1 hypothetical protein [Thermoguttaceae bacterium]